MGHSQTDGNQYKGQIVASRGAGSMRTRGSSQGRGHAHTAHGAAPRTGGMLSMRQLPGQGHATHRVASRKGGMRHTRQLRSSSDLCEDN